MARVTFREGRPAADMTRDEVVTWLLGSIGETTFAPGMAVAWLIPRLVDSLKDGAELPVDTNQGAYVLTVTTTGRWYRRTRTYHVRER